MYLTVKIPDAAGDEQIFYLGESQVHVLTLLCPELPNPKPMARTVRVLRLLADKGLTAMEEGKWRITTQGKIALQQMVEKNYRSTFSARL